MEQLIVKYNKECSFISNTSDRLWRIGQSVIVTVAVICILIYKQVIIVFVSLLFVFKVFEFICESINLMDMEKKLGIKCEKLSMMFTKDYRIYIYKKMDKFQKDWITSYCKKNKIDKIRKLEIIKDELNRKNNCRPVKYLDPVIIGALALVIWERIIEFLSNEFGVFNTATFAIFVGCMISMVIGYFKREIKEQNKFMGRFCKWSGYERLNDLLIYKILKCKN